MLIDPSTQSNQAGDTSRLLIVLIILVVITAISALLFPEPAAEVNTTIDRQAEMRADEAQNSLQASVSRQSIPIESVQLGGTVTTAHGALLSDISIKPGQDSSINRSLPILQSSNLYIDIGWVAGDSRTNTPNASSQWTIVKGDLLSPGEDVVLEWSNQQGLMFSRRLSMTDDYVIQVEQTVHNKTDHAVTLGNYARLVKQDITDVGDYFFAHEGFLGYWDGSVNNVDYGDDVQVPSSSDLWIGSSEHNWLVALKPGQSFGNALPQGASVSGDGYASSSPDPSSPNQIDASNSAGSGYNANTNANTNANNTNASGQLTSPLAAPSGPVENVSSSLNSAAKLTFKGRFFSNSENTFQADYISSPIGLAPNTSFSVSHLVYVGSKSWAVLKAHENVFPSMQDAIDWGWLTWLSKGLLWLLINISEFFNGSYGWGIIVLTILIRLALVPANLLSAKTSHALKRIAPQIKQSQNMKLAPTEQALYMRKLYKQNNVSFKWMFLPIVLQAPMFFYFYKLLMIAGELQMQGFYSIEDLSRPDNSNLFSLWGLWVPPEFLVMGFWPFLAGFTMFLQLKVSMSNNDQNPVSLGSGLNVKKYLPYVLGVLIAVLMQNFPAGLMLYWAVSNTIGVLIHYWTTSYLKRL